MFKRLSLQRSGRSFVTFFSAMTVVLSLLAFLQYRWIKEVSDAEERQLQDNLNVSTAQFAAEFQEQLRQLAAAFHQTDSNARTDAEIVSQYRQGYEGWTAAASYPELLRDGFLLRTTDSRGIELLQFNVKENRLDPVEWPSDFASLRSAELRGGPGRPMPRFSMDSVPAVMIPLSPPRRESGPPPPPPNDRGRRGRGGWRGPPPPPPPPESNWIVLRLNRDFFQQKFLPQLAARWFPVTGDSIYDILIMESRTRNVVFRSAPNLNPDQFETADARVHLAAPEVDRPQRGLRGAPPPGQAAGPLSGWDLLARNRTGSLHAAAGQLRRRNIAISIAILGILAAGFAGTWLSSERVRALGRMQIELAAGISHELRTPLAVIRSAGYNMVAGNISSREDIVRYGHLFQEQGRRLSEIVEQALLFAQSHSGKNNYALEPVDVAAVVEKAIQSCEAIEPEAGNPSNRVAAKFASDLPLAMTDSNALSHCLHNLIVNALKYAGTSGGITVEAKPATRKNISEIEIAVTDNGPGIDSADLPHIFEPFFRGKNTNKIQGNGLGLYLVKRTMESVGGRVAVVSSAGAGARFLLYVPTVPEARNATNA